MKMKESRGDRIFNVINMVIITTFLIGVLYPLIYVLSASISDPNAVLQGQVRLFPVGFTLEGYKAVFTHKLIISGYLNAIFYMVTGTALNVFLTISAAYPLSRKDLSGRKAIMSLFIFAMIFNGGMIPTYLVVKNLHLINSRWAMILPNAIGVWNVIIARTYFQTSIPDELLEASQLDGCTDYQFIAHVALKLSGPIIAVITLFYAVGHWNSYFNALLYLNDQEKFPLQMVLRSILIENEMTAEMFASADLDAMAYKENLRELLKYSLIVVASVPLLLIYPFVQKHFVKGIMIGAVKG